MSTNTNDLMQIVNRLKLQQAMQNKNSGSTAKYVIGGILLLGAAGIGAWYVIQKNKAKEDEKKNIGSSIDISRW